MVRLSISQRWHQLIKTHLTCQFIDVGLRSYGQVMLQNNALSGLIFWWLCCRQTAAWLSQFSGGHLCQFDSIYLSA